MFVSARSIMKQLSADECSPPEISISSFFVLDLKSSFSPSLFFPPTNRLFIQHAAKPRCMIR